MKRSLLLLAALSLFAAPAAWSSDVRVGGDIRIRFGDPVRAPIAVAHAPLFLYPPSLGFHVAVGVPYDLFYIDNFYYTRRGNVWYGAPHYGGPWYYVKPGHVPPGLVKHKHWKVREYRDMEYRNYLRDRDHYRGHRFNPDDRQWRSDRGRDYERGRDFDKGKGRDRDRERDRDRGRGRD